MAVNKPKRFGNSPAERLAQVEVLLLDNDTKIVELMRNVMKTLGFEALHTAKDGFEGLKILREKPVDMIITDWDLQPVAEYPPTIPENAVIMSEWGSFPPNNGASFVKSLRHSPYSPCPFVPIIMLTGPTMPNNIRYARDAGVNEILMKPIVAADLCERIVSIVSKPRPFITCENYKGPCRRRKDIPLGDKPERRHHDIQVIRIDSVAAR